MVRSSNTTAIYSIVLSWHAKHSTVVSLRHVSRPEIVAMTQGATVQVIKTEPQDIYEIKFIKKQQLKEHHGKILSQDRCTENVLIR